ncbi:MAG TPA: tRNA (guanosine(46)-N7)-methyltransferase TrmB [Segetibacter sp.]|jgi:tRNA (guanine-N7-)-methyltransferase
MGLKKLQRFAEIKTFNNVLEYPENISGKWKEFFKNENPIVLELACGKGEYAVSLAELYNERNFIGVDIKGNRLWVGAKNALDGNLTNVAFLRSQIERIDEFFDKGEVSEIWITFPDPQLRISKAKKRLTHPKFLRLYMNILVEKGIIHLKTDSPDLYNFTKTVIQVFECELLRDINDVYAEENISEELTIKTYYETLDIAKSQRIHYLQFRLNDNLPLEKDEILKKLISESDVD